MLFEKEGREIHFVNPAPPEPGSRIDSLLKARGHGSVISGDEARELETFLKLARDYEHVRVVVTTRLNIFREAVGETRGDARVAELEKSIRVHTSYRRETLLDILHRHTNFYRPRWSSDAEIVAALDEQLPSLLPAPHNIEFFVRTSESLNTLDDVLRHVEESKEMVKALADWMGYLPAPEQVFLLLVEVAASAATLFPGTPAASMDVEAAYMETLAYLFKRKHLPGIPTASFENARAKFDQILLERRDDDSQVARLDFVHPSYHEAFWRAARHHQALAHWWQLMQSDVADIFKDFDNKPDLVQLRMIERYGTIDRDLDRLLLISAESDDPEEQIIAFERMLEGDEKFVSLPQFSRCVSSITSTENRRVKLRFLNFIKNRFDQLPFTVIDAVPFLLFNEDDTVRTAAEELTKEHLRGEQNPIRDNERLQTWEFLLKLFEGFQPNMLGFRNLVSLAESMNRTRVSLKKLTSPWITLSPEDFKLFIKTTYHPAIVMLMKQFIRVFPYDELTEDNLKFLLSCSGFIQYEALSRMLMRYERLSSNAKALASSFVSHPQERWVGGAIGQATNDKRRGKFLSSLVVKIAKNGPKEVAGALLAELAFNAQQKTLHEKHKAPLSELIKDKETVRHAFAWTDYVTELIPEFSEEDAKTLKAYLLKLPADLKGGS